MALLTDCEIWFLRANPLKPNSKFDKENPTWECQIRTSSKVQKKAWAELNLNCKAVVPDDGDPYFRVNLKKSSIKKDGTAAEPVKVVNGALDPLDPDTIGNGSVGNIRIFQYEYPKKEGGTGVATILMGIQITTHIEFERKAREDEFAPTDTTTIPVEPSGDDEFKVKAPAAKSPSVSPSVPKSPSLLKPAAKEAPAGFDDMDDDIPF
jgi:hypothetical protein